MRLISRFLIVGLLAGGLSVLGPQAVAATIAVNTTKDVVDAGDGKCSLREAVTATASDLPSGPGPGECPTGSSAENDTIRLMAETTYNLTLDSGADHDDNLDGDLDIAGDGTTIRGGKGTTIRQRAGDQRVIDIFNSASVALERVKITGGRAQAPSPVVTTPGASLYGGGIRNAGTLSLRRTTVAGNRAGTGDADAGVAGGRGGGIDNTGQLIVEQGSKISNNAAGDGGTKPGEYSGSSAGGAGGGIYNAGLLLVLNSKIVNNRAGNGGHGGDGNGIYNSSRGSAGGSGAGIVNTFIADIERSTISGNRAGNGGHGGDGDPTSGGASQDGSEAGEGGHGAGIWAPAGAVSTTVIGSTISRNAAAAGGDGGVSAPGTAHGSDGDDGSGGGLLMRSPLTLRNTTISGNTAFYGGGIFTDSDVLANNVTIARNTVMGVGGGIFVYDGTFALHNSILADNKADAFVECNGNIVGNSNNLIEDADGCGGAGATDILSTDPRMGALDANGGPTKTHALKRGSPAINEGNPGPATGTVPACESTDQRGRLRSACDIGAYEKV